MINTFRSLSSSHNENETHLIVYTKNNFVQSFRTECIDTAFSRSSRLKGCSVAFYTLDFYTFWSMSIIKVILFRLCALPSKNFITNEKLQNSGTTSSPVRRLPFSFNITFC